MNFDCDIIITDPCYIMKNDEDWDLCNYGSNLEALNINSFITSYEGDCVGCDIIDISTGKILGEFASDSVLFLL